MLHAFPPVNPACENLGKRMHAGEPSLQKAKEKDIESFLGIGKDIERQEERTRAEQEWNSLCPQKTVAKGRGGPTSRRIMKRGSCVAKASMMRSASRPYKQWRVLGFQSGRPRCSRIYAMILCSPSPGTLASDSITCTPTNPVGVHSLHLHARTESITVHAYQCTHSFGTMVVSEHIYEAYAHLHTNPSF